MIIFVCEHLLRSMLAHAKILFFSGNKPILISSFESFCLNEKSLRRENHLLEAIMDKTEFVKNSCMRGKRKSNAQANAKIKEAKG